MIKKAKMISNEFVGVLCITPDKIVLVNNLDTKEQLIFGNGDVYMELYNEFESSFNENISFETAQKYFSITPIMNIQ